MGLAENMCVFLSGRVNLYTPARRQWSRTRPTASRDSTRASSSDSVASSAALRLGPAAQLSAVPLNVFESERASKYTNTNTRKLHIVENGTSFISYLLELASQR